MRKIIQVSIRLPIIALVLILFNTCRAKPSPIPTGQIEALNKWINMSLTSPADLLADEIDKKKHFALIHDSPYRSDSFKLMAALVPLMYDLGVQNIGVYFLDTAYQDRIDQYIYGESTRHSAKAIMMSNNAILGYQEYVDFLIYIKRFNENRRPDTPPIRLMALSRNGQPVPEVIQNLISEEKRLLWISPQFLQYLPATDRLVISHFGPTADGLRWNGLVETVQQQRSLTEQSFAFRIDAMPFASWQYTDPSQPDIVIVTSYPYETVKPIRAFFNRDNYTQYLRFFPELQKSAFKLFMPRRMERYIVKQSRQHANMNP